MFTSISPAFGVHVKWKARIFGSTTELMIMSMKYSSEKHATRSGWVMTLLAIAAICASVLYAVQDARAGKAEVFTGLVPGLLSADMIRWPTSKMVRH